MSHMQDCYACVETIISQVVCATANVSALKSPFTEKRRNTKIENDRKLSNICVLRMIYAVVSFCFSADVSVKLYRSSNRKLEEFCRYTICLCAN